MQTERLPPWDKRLRQPEVGETRLHITSFPRPESSGYQVQLCSRCHEVIGWDAVELPDFGYLHRPGSLVQETVTARPPKMSCPVTSLEVMNDVVAAARTVRLCNPEASWTT